MTRTHDVDAVLRNLDPGAARVDPAGPRARADLDRILATSRSTDPGRGAHPAPPTSRRPAARPRRTVRRLVVGAAVLATAAGVIALPAVTGSGDVAFASWTAVPSGMTPVERTAAVDSCRKDMKEGGGADQVEELDRAMPAIAERRGVWDNVVLASEDGFSAQCITDSSAGFMQGGMTGYVSPAATFVAPGPREVIAYGLGSTSFGADVLSMAVGAAGPGVTGVLYRSATHGDVSATVSNGYFALWFPGDELERADSTHPVEVEVTYADGTTAPTELTLG